MSGAIGAPDVLELVEIERRVLWLATWMIHHANNIRAHGEIKVGGHQASSASMATILTSLYLTSLRPEDRVAVKPHASPVFHALQYLAGNLDLARMKLFRGYGGVQSYPSRTKDVDDVDFSTGSVGLGVAQTLFSSLVQDYVRAHGFMAGRRDGRMIALVGDAEMDEGNIYEALIEGWKHGLGNCWWIVDYNRQSLDAVAQEGLWEKFDSMFRNFGWEVIICKYGSLQQAAFSEPGGDQLKQWIDHCPNQLYSALTFQGAAAWRKRLLDEIGDQGPVTALIERRTDAELSALMANLGGHDHETLARAFHLAARHDRPTLFIAYTVKGFGLPLAGHKDNHAGLLTSSQIAAFREAQGVREGYEWEKWEGARLPHAKLEARIRQAPFFSADTRRLSAPTVSVPTLQASQREGPLSTQFGFGQILADVAKEQNDFAARIVTASPDVTVSTNLGGWVNRRGLFAKQAQADLFKVERIPSTYAWSFSDQGQHFELGIAESNLFLLLSALGLSHSINGARLLPVGTVYDPFILRAADQLNYACYQGARFLLAATPSGVTLSHEGGAHQSISTSLVGLAQDGLASFEPAFLDELAVIMRFAFEYMQREGDPKPDDLLCDACGGAVYLRLSTRPVEQPARQMTPELAEGILAGGYWQRIPGPNAEVVIAYTGAVAPEAIAATGYLGEARRDIGLLSITSADRLHAGWTAAQRARRSGFHAVSHVERLLNPLPPQCSIVTVSDAHPAILGWLGSVRGNRSAALGVERFGQTGAIADLYRINGIDANGISRAAEELTPGQAVRLVRQV